MSNPSILFWERLAMQVLTGPGPVLPLPVYWELVLLGATVGKPDCKVNVSGIPVLLGVGLASLSDGKVYMALQSRGSKSLQGHLLAIFL